MADEPVAEVTPPVTPAPEAKWFDGFEPDFKEYINRRGLADKDPTAAFLEAAKAHREAEAYIGVPKEQLLKKPKDDAPPEDWDKFHEQLGWSKNADDYKLEGLKFEDGTEAEDGFKDFVRAQAQELKLSPAATAKLAENTMKFLEGAEKATTAETQAEATKALEQLRQSWGPNYEANQVIADNAYAAMMKAAGFTQEQMTAAIQKLGEATGRAETMQLLLAVGQRLGEDKFIGGGQPSGGLGPRNAEQAKARLAELKNDSTWTQRFLAGGNAEVKEFNDLSTLAYGNA